MRKLYLLGILITVAIIGNAIPKTYPEIVSVSYQTVVNGKARTGGSKIMLLCSPVAAKSWTESDSKKLLSTVAKETSYIDFTQKKTFQVARFSDGKVINTPLEFSEYPVLTETGETAVILGYNCKHLKTSLRSNSIDIWYTTETGTKGTPAMAYGIPDGLVLKVVRNGNFEISATEVKLLKKKDTEQILPDEMGESLALPLYKHRITENLITTVNVFTSEQVSFGNEIENPTDTESEKTFKYSAGTVILKKVKLPVVPDDT
ncbi:MAG: DUF4412 domain-containing protein, partial [Bacteroidota bacterium]|nr:DUF4412 domain-containing protein [Bacteroidota bacterium]